MKEEQEDHTHTQKTRNPQWLSDKACFVLLDIVASHYCVRFCCTMKSLSYMYTYIPSLLGPPPTSALTHLGHQRAPS